MSDVDPVTARMAWAVSILSYVVSIFAVVLIVSKMGKGSVEF